MSTTVIYELLSDEHDEQVSLGLFATRELAEAHVLHLALNGSAGDLRDPVEIVEREVAGEMVAAPEHAPTEVVPASVADAVHLARDVVDAWRQLTGPRSGQLHAVSPELVSALAALARSVYQCGVPVVLKSERGAL